MREYRQDPFTDRWIIVATDRAGRPNEFGHGGLTTGPVQCPFCPGQEFQTPATVDFLPTEGIEQDWQVRVVPNRFPALTQSTAVSLDTLIHSEGPPVHRVVDKGFSDLTPWIGYGRHEVIIETRQHAPNLNKLTVEELTLVLQAYQRCLVRAGQDEHLAHGLIFKNQGKEAAATLSHSHSQFLATTMIPASIQRELVVSESFAQRTGECLYCYVAGREASQGERLVFATEQFRCLVPYASRVTYEMCILPISHSSRFEFVPTGELREFAQCLRIVLRKLSSLVGEVALNFWIHSAPFDSSRYDHYHWHMELIPRLFPMAGFEWGADAFVNVVSPEDAAGRLRAVS